MTTSADQRRTQILAHLESRGCVNLRQFSSQLGVSELSLRRDLIILEDLGLLKRVLDGAVAIPHYRQREDHLRKMSLNREKKERIGQAAASLIQTGECVILDSGTTPLQVARHICADLRLGGDLTVFTASLPIFREIAGCPGIGLMLLGGIYRAEHDALVGPQAIDMLKEVQADKLFLGADGVTLSKGITTGGMLEAEVDRYMLRAAKEVIVVADSTKIGIIGLVSLIHLDQVDKLVTNPDAPPDFLAEARRLGVEVILA